MSDVVHMNRRLFLRGTSGALLALPLLPSLFASDQAHAQAMRANKCFVHLRTGHGGVSTANMWPSASALTESMSYVHTIRRGPLAATVSNGNAVISPCLTAPSSVLTPSLVAKLNALHGLDVSTNLAHNFGAWLGYYDLNKQTPAKPRASIDQLMAYSPAFYPDTAGVRARSVIIAKTDSGSHGYNTPGVKSSGVSPNALGGIESSLQLFTMLLGGVPSTPGATRPPVVNQVLAAYQRLRSSNRRLSAGDKVRLDQHLDAVAQLQHRLGTALGAGCVPGPTPTVDNLSLRPFDGVPAKNVQFFQLINDVIAVALNCGVTRVVTLQVDEHNQALTFTPRPAQGEDWHENVAHAASSNPAMQALVLQFNQTFFSGVYLDLVSKLDSFSNGQGGTLLDQSLVCWGQECGNVTHLPISLPVITAGSAGGFLKTGSYCDYRDTSRPLSGDSSTGTEKLLPGLLYNQWLTTALQAMGVPPAEWGGEPDHPGYGARVTYQPVSEYFFSNVGLTSAQVYSDALWNKTAEVLPYLA